MGLAVLPSITIAVLHIVYITLGVDSLFEDVSLRNDVCGQTYHVYKYATTSTAFVFFFLATFFMMPSGGESARARAVLCVIMYSGFAVWGTLMQFYMTDTCHQVLAEKFKGMHFFLLYSTVHNTAFAVFITLHELYIGHWLGHDLLVIFELHNKRGGSNSAEPAFPQPPNTIPASIADATAVVDKAAAGESTFVNVAAPSAAEEHDALLKSVASKPVPSTQSPPAL